MIQLILKNIFMQEIGRVQEDYPKWENTQEQMLKKNLEKETIYQKQKRRDFNIRHPRKLVAYGPICAETPTEAKRQIGKMKGLEVWETK